MSRSRNTSNTGCAHLDKPWLEKVRLHLNAMKNYGRIHIDYWDDTQLKAGDKWESVITEELTGRPD